MRPEGRDGLVGDQLVQRLGWRVVEEGDSRERVVWGERL